MMSNAAADIGRAATYPVRVVVDPSTAERDRLTVGFRMILAIPHLLLVGGPLGLTLAWSSSSDAGFRYDWGAGGGVLGAVAVVCALIGWFAIVFGDGPHPARVDIPDPVAEHDRVSVAFRIVLAIPLFIVVWVVTLGWVLTTVFAWFAILLTGRYPGAYPPFSLD